MAVGPASDEGFRRASEFTGDTRVGDASQRVTVPMPRSMQDLQSAANRHFYGNSGMYQHGKIPLTQPSHIAGVKHNDVIVVSRDDMPREAPTMSTHNAHYIKYDIEVKPPPAPKPPPEQSARFEGVTSYGADFVRHPMERRKPAKQAQSMWDSGRRADFTGQSTYKTQYPWHEVKRPPPMAKTKESKEPSAAFEGTTMYNSDFVKHPVRPRSTMAPRERNVDAGPFEGVTTYNVDYKKHANARTQKHPGYGATLKTDNTPFEGSTEYAREYLKHQFESRPVVHIEPEMRRYDNRGKRPKSAPTGARPRSRARTPR